LIKQVRIRLFVASSALLVLIAVVAVIGLRDSLVGVSLGEAIAAAISIAVIAAAVLSALAARMVRRDLRDLVTVARARPSALPRDDEPHDVDDWVHDMAADAANHRHALDRSRALLSAVLESMSDGVIALDDANRILVMNEAARRLIGLTATPIGEALIDVIRAPALIELVRSPRAGSGEVQLQPEVRAVARISDPMESSARVLILEDVTTMRRLETIRRDFVANVSHELRTPVSIIRVNAETLQGGAAADPQIAPRLLDGIHRNAERLARILADLLDLSRLDAGQFRFERTEVKIRSASEAARASVESAAGERAVTIHVDVDDAAAVRADARALDHVLVNLVDNAVKYGNQGGNVWIRCRALGDRIRVEVADDGPGISPKHQERVFERFYRVDSGRAREAGGTGLGLAIVKHLVESMGGTVGVEANTPQGTVFWLDLPSMPATAAA
jgi:two-component system, OmpR family, phosphate regulon sensor histidine kinase PhoR